MKRLESELQNREEAETFRQALEAKVPSSLKREDWKYKNEKHGIDFYHITFQQAGKRAGTYSYEKSPNGLYICTLDLRDLEIAINIPGRIMPTNTIEFFHEEMKFLQAGKEKDFQKRGYELRPTTGRNYSAFSFMHQAITKGEKFVARYDQERDGNKYVCHLDIDRSELEQINELFQDWVKELLKKSS